LAWTGAKHIPKGFELRVPRDLLKVPPEQFLAVIPPRYREQAQSPDRYHEVKPGDALSLIARRYNTTVSELVAWNGLSDSHRIRVGQVLRLPQGGGQSP
jgi:LysM repeat protein